MPVEIRELIIKTAISAAGSSASAKVMEKDLNTLKKQLLEECKKIILENTRKDSYNR